MLISVKIKFLRRNSENLVGKSGGGATRSIINFSRPNMICTFFLKKKKQTLSNYKSTVLIKNKFRPLLFSSHRCQEDTFFVKKNKKQKNVHIFIQKWKTSMKKYEKRQQNEFFNHFLHVDLSRKKIKIFSTFKTCMSGRLQNQTK